MPQRPKVKNLGEHVERISKNDATHVFAESLDLDVGAFELKTIDKRIEAITNEFKGMTFSEALMAGAEGATAKLLSIVWEAATPKLFGRSLVDVMTGITPSIRVPIASVAHAYQVGHAGGAPETAESYSYAEAVARLWQCIPVVGRTLVEDAMWDVIARQYREGARAMAQAETQEIIDVLETAGAANQATGTGAGYSEAEIVSQIELLEDADYNATDLIMNTHNYWTDLMQNTKIITASSFGNEGEGVMVTGRMPKIYGLNVWVSSLVTVDTPMVIDREKAGILYVRRDITVEDYEDPKKDLAGAVLTSRFRAKVVDGSAVAGLAAS